jgi:hypothetical protein
MDVAGSEAKAKVLRMKAEPVHPIKCPCCKQPVRVPTLEIVIDHYRASPQEARILTAIWRGSGRSVPTAQIYEVMRLGHTGERPPPSDMYIAFKVALCHLRKKIAGSGITIENVGYGQGYRISLDR